MKRMTHLIILTLAVSAFLAIGCSQQPAQHATQYSVQESAILSPPMQQYPPPAPKTEGSLFTDSVKPNLFTDVRAQNIGDIVTINIVETSKASKQAKTKLSRDSEVGAGLASMLGYETSLGLKDDFKPKTALDLKYESDYKGSGSTDRKDNMTAQISARVIQILPNGNLVIRGSREVTVNYEKQFIILQGVIRPEDITPENSVLSSYIADAKIEYKGKGDITRQQRKGWGSRFLDVIWPF